MPTLYDNFSQVKQYIDQEKPDLTSYVTKTELAGMSYATTSDLSNYLLSPTISGYEGQMKLFNDGFFEVTSSGAVRAKSFTYNQLNSWSAYTLINRNSLRNYVDGRLAEIESSYATTTYVADYVAEHGGGGSTVIDENIIPKETNTYTLGDSTYLYNAAYATNIYTENVSYTSGKSSIKMNDRNIDIYANNKKLVNVSDYGGVVPMQSDVNLGSSSNNFGSTYTNNLYLGGTNIEDIFVSKTDAAFIPYTYNGFTSYISTYTYNTSSLYLDGNLALNKGNGLVLGGKGAAVVGEYTLANGENAYACADNSIALGRNASTFGWSSFACGRNVTTWNYAEVALGIGNFSSSSSYTYTGHGNYNPDTENAYKETVFSIGGAGMNVTYNSGWNRIEIRANNDIYINGVGNYDGRNASDSTTYSLQYILNHTFSYNSITGELTINTF